MGTPDAGVGVESNQSEGHSADDAEKTAVEKTPVPEAAQGGGPKSDKKKREQKKLQVLPGGFVDGAEQGGKGRAAGPVIEEMVEGTQDSYGKDEREILFVQRLIKNVLHGKILLIAIYGGEGDFMRLL